MRVLVMVDEGDSTSRVLQYLGRVASGRGAVGIVLAHLAPGLSPALLETGGAEQPEQEERIEADLRRQQRASISAAQRKSARLLETARGKLVRAGVARSRVELRESSPFDAGSAVEAVLALADEADCGTIVVGHRAHGWLSGVAGGHLAERLVREAAGRAVWVVD
jgi:nucleotide-binding universal stress UspA family protein